MGDTATTITIFYAVLVVLGIVISVAIAVSTLGRRQQADPARLAHRETYWLAGVMCALAVLLFSTIFLAPYGESAGPNRQVVRIEAFQFGWKVAKNDIRVGRPVEFRFTSADVNHGFGLYDEDDVLLKQVQVVPDYEQRLVYTFDEPGTYRVLCMEYCGVAHHAMETTIEVRA